MTVDDLSESPPFEYSDVAFEPIPIPGDPAIWDGYVHVAREQGLSATLQFTGMSRRLSLVSKPDGIEGFCGSIYPGEVQIRAEGASG